MTPGSHWERRPGSSSSNTVRWHSTGPSSGARGPVRVTRHSRRWTRSRTCWPRAGSSAFAMVRPRSARAPSDIGASWPGRIAPSSGDVSSETLKRREWYRPVAPVLLREVAEQAFGGEVARSHLAPFMLGAWRLRPEWEARFAGVLHADGSLRAQVIREDDHDQTFLCALLTRLWRRHGIAGLINTSFNGPGEPIVHRPEDALPCAHRLGLDGVVIDGSLYRP